MEKLMVESERKKKKKEETSSPNLEKCGHDRRFL
jgi:hypothetical protein